MFISGTKDSLTPNTMAHELYDLATASPRKKVFDVKGGSHNALYKKDKDYWNKVNAFLSKVS